MTKRGVAEAKLITEHGPVPSIELPSGPYGYGTAWGALGFTVLIAGSLIWGITQSPDLLATLTASPRSQTVATAAPKPTVAPTIPPTGSLSTAWVSQSPWPVLSVGGTATVSVTFRNSGTATWQRGTPSEIRLGTIDTLDPAMAVRWPAADRPAIQSEAVVLPGQLVTFTFDVRGVTAGTYKLRLRPIVESVGWLNDEGVYVSIDVR